MKFEGMPPQPVEVRLAARPVHWRVRQVCELEVGDDPLATGAIRKRYRLRVYGPLPFSIEVGESELVASTYVGRPYWWVRPVHLEE